jgi:hypothetical protein
MPVCAVINPALTAFVQLHHSRVVSLALESITRDKASPNQPINNVWTHVRDILPLLRVESAFCSRLSFTVDCKRSGSSCRLGPQIWPDIRSSMKYHETHRATFS